MASRQRSATDDASVARTLLDAVAEQRADDAERAAAGALDARTHARAAERVDLEAEALYHMASLAHDRGDVDDAFAFASESVELAGRSDTQASKLTDAWSTHLLGIVHFQSGNYPAALDHCRRALEMYRASAPRPIDEGRILHTIAAVYQSMGDHDRAIETYEHALAVNETVGRRDVDVAVLGNLARLFTRSGDTDAAIDAGRRAADRAADDAPHLEASILADLAEAYVAAGDELAAAHFFGRAQAVVPDDASPRERLMMCLAAARLSLARDRLDTAVAELLRALDLCDRVDDRQLELEVHDLLAVAYRRVERFAEALHHREHHAAIDREINADAASLRLRALSLAQAHELDRQRAEITELRSASLSASFARAHHDPDAYHLEAFERLAALAEYRGGNTTAHTAEVGDLSAEIAHAIGRQPHWCEQLRLAARLHDIGKVAVADTVLLKPGPLTLQDYADIKQHTVLGRRLLSGVSTPLFELAAEVAWTHHEWWDGSGYPNGLAGDDIPLSGRIVAIADVFDSLSTRRVYKREWTRDEAARFITSGAGSQFDPSLVDAFSQVIELRD
ncbi:MAG: HD domain-containing phosphohydrolase [Actinomycetota bacterium]